VSVPSEIVIVVVPLPFAPTPIEVAENTPVDAGAVVVDTATDAGETVTIVGSLLTAVKVPLKAFSVTVICWLLFTPPNAMLEGLAVSGIGVGEAVGDAVGEGAGVGLALVPPADALATAFGVASVPPPPQPTSMAKQARP
jgi:hypothetical protein